MMAESKYREAGVDIDAYNRAVEQMKPAIRATFTPAVLADVGSFGGLYALQNLPPQPVLVASTDGVGTKVKLAADLGRWRGIGVDIVNHCVNDILVQNARPLFFLDYIAASKLAPEQVAEVVTGMAEACRAAGCALLGGETAEMPGVYAEGAFDVAGTIVGLVDRDEILPKTERMAASDLLFGLPRQRAAHQRLFADPASAGGRGPDADAERRAQPGRCAAGLRTAAMWPKSSGCRPRRRAAAGFGAHHGRRLRRERPAALLDSLCAVETRTWRAPEVFALLVERSGFDARGGFPRLQHGHRPGVDCAGFGAQCSAVARSD